MKKRLFSVALAALMMVGMSSLSALANPVDIGELGPESEATALWDPEAEQKPITRATEKVYANKGYSYYYVPNYGELPLGSYGSTNVVNSSDGTYKNHYTTASCYEGNYTWYSDRKWGMGMITAYTGRVSGWSITGCNVYYGW